MWQSYVRGCTKDFLPDPACGSRGWRTEVGIALALPPLVHLVILLNAGSGPVDEARCRDRVKQISDAFDVTGLPYEVKLCEAAQLTATARELASGTHDLVVAAGGDGTVSSIAAGLVGTAMPLAVLPMGTLNHFSKDLGMPQDLAEAARAIRDGVTQRIDVGEVNGRVFVNNSSIGLYPEAVISRDDQRKQRGWGKWSAMLLAVCRVLWRFPLLRVLIATPQGSVLTKTPFVFVGNNEYETGIRALGKRESLDRGHLAVYTVRTSGRLAMLWLVLKAMFRKPEHIENFEVAHVAAATVHLKRRTLAVALDGEVIRMASPLEYRIRAGGLTVRRAPETVTEAVVEPPPESQEQRHDHRPPV
ncbi:MAG TPA: diacylglycerol kinase family protein [Kofleriaceae bacterium]